MWAAAEFAEQRDPSQEINNYAVANRLVPPNVRVDTGQPDVWRDYQQVLSELGLMYTTRLLKTIKPTPIGLALLDGSLGFKEILTSQALRLQYPNGHHTQSQAVRLTNGGTSSRENFAVAQAMAGVRLRPGVLVWQVLRKLQSRGEQISLSVDDVERYLMPASTHDDTASVVNHLISARHGGTVLPRLGSAQRRSAQDWLKFLARTAIFALDSTGLLAISPFGIREAREIDAICRQLTAPRSFWTPHQFDRDDRLSWYTFFGSLDVLSAPAMASEVEEDDFPRGPEKDEDDEQVASSIALKEFENHAREEAGEENRETTIQSVYSADLSRHAHRLHDNMVALIAAKCSQKNARVFHDPKSVDLLVEFNRKEFLIEVKSVNFSNLVKKIRLGVGQVLHYDYLRSKQANNARRKVLAVAAYLPKNHWVVPFLVEHVDMDFLCLDHGSLRVHSSSNDSLKLFS